MNQALAKCIYHTDMIRYALFILILTAFCQQVIAQQPAHDLIVYPTRQAKLIDVLYWLINDQEVDLAFANGIIPDQWIYLPQRPLEPEEFLRYILQNTELTAQRGKTQWLIVKKKQPIFYNFSGYMEDEESGERLASGYVLHIESGSGTTVNEYGYFSLKLLEGKHQIVFSALGYKGDTLDILLQENDWRILKLHHSLTLQEVVVNAYEKPDLVARNDFIAPEIDVLNMRNYPSLAGEPDVLRLAYLMPGVTSGADGFGGMHVRGGSPDQNLVLIDGVPVYNYSHGAGMLSVVNSSAVKNVKFYKSGIPARYGGRLSSVMDIQTREGNQNNWQGQANVGLAAVGFSLEGPVVKEKSSVFVSGRLSVLNTYVKPISEKIKAQREVDGATGYQFKDFSIKWNAEITKKDKLYLSAYFGDDNFQNTRRKVSEVLLSIEPRPHAYYFQVDENYRERIDWGNSVMALRYNHTYNNRLFSNITLTYSNLFVNYFTQTADSLILKKNNSTIAKSIGSTRYFSEIEDLTAKVDFDLAGNLGNRLLWGAQVSKIRFKPGIFRSNDWLEEEFDNLNPETATEEMESATIYGEGEWNIGKKLFLNAGARANWYHTGKKNYAYLEPRISFNYRAAKVINLTGSYSWLTQPFHLLSNSNLGLPTDLWVPTTENIPPQKTLQSTIGADILVKNHYFIGLEAFYKKLYQLSTFSEGVQIYNNWKENTTQGEGKVVGAELLVKKITGNTQGWIAYTLQKADRRFDNINLGRVFPFKFDRRHEVKLVFLQRLSNRFSVSGNWIFASGAAYSLPRKKYLTAEGDIPILDFGQKNQYRVEPYHRLDLGMNGTFGNERLKHEFHFGVYNVYYKKNPIYYTLRTNWINDNGKLKETQELSALWLFPVLPSFSYSLRF